MKHKGNRITLWLTALTGVGVLACALALKAAEPDSTQALRHEAETLMQHARELKQQGQHEQAQKVMREAETLQAKAERSERNDASPDRPTDRAELKAKMDKMVEKIHDLRAAGRMDEAMELKQRLQELDRRLAESNRGEFGERPVPPEGRDLPSLHRRLHHVRVAIDNLHAAGMHDLADRLMEPAEKLEQQIRQAQHDTPPGAGRGEGELDSLRAEVRELRQMMHQLKEQLDQPRRER